MWQCFLRWTCHILHLTRVWWITRPPGYRECAHQHTNKHRHTNKNIFGTETLKHHSVVMPIFFLKYQATPVGSNHSLNVTKSYRFKYLKKKIAFFPVPLMVWRGQAHVKSLWLQSTKSWLQSYLLLKQSISLPKCVKWLYLPAFLASVDCKKTSWTVQKTDTARVSCWFVDEHFEASVL